MTVLSIVRVVPEPPGRKANVAAQMERLIPELPPHPEWACVLVADRLKVKRAYDSVRQAKLPVDAMVRDGALYVRRPGSQSVGPRRKQARTGDVNWDALSRVERMDAFVSAWVRTRHNVQDTCARLGVSEKTVYTYRREALNAGRISR